MMKKKAYAKVNLSLKVISKRKDGFHNLEMIMTRIDLFDEITFLKNDKIDVVCDGVDKESNLVYKIALYLKEKYSVKDGVKIVIDKKIPIQAGLGGGSSDAALTIESLDKMWRLGLSERTKIRIANMFGSDIPFFITKDAAFVWGKGENISNFKIKKKMPMLLVKPNVGFSTKEVFGKVKKYSNKNTLFLLEEDLKTGNISSACEKMSNDLEDALLNDASFAVIKNIKDELYSLKAIKAMMSGSGSSVFAIFADKKSRDLAYEAINDGRYCVYKIKNI